MAEFTSIETRLAIELERKYLLQPEPLPSDIIAELGIYPALLVKHRFGVTSARDLIRVLQPWTERDAIDGDQVTKVAGARYTLLLGAVDEPWVRVLVDDGRGGLTPWHDRRVDAPLLTIVGTEPELAQLALPRSATEIEALLRRQSALGIEVDWLLKAIFGVQLRQVARWLGGLVHSNPEAFVALVRRDVVRGVRSLADAKRKLAPEDRCTAHQLVIIYEIARLVEHQRVLGGPDRATADAVLAAGYAPTTTRRRFEGASAAGEYMHDAWMFISSLRRFDGYLGPTLHRQYPLVFSSGQQMSDNPDVIAALGDPVTYGFHMGALAAEPAVCMVSKSVQSINGEQPIGFLYGVEQMRLGVLALSRIARKSGHKPSSQHARRSYIGRLALYLLRTVDKPAFAAYAQRWQREHAVQMAGLTAKTLNDELVDENSAEDFGAALVVKSEMNRKPIGVAVDSDFNPWLWNRVSNTASWAGYSAVARGEAKPQADDGTRTRALLAGIAYRGASAKRCYKGSESAVHEAVAVCAAVGGHSTPLARDPALFLAASGQVGIPPRGFKVTKMVPRAQRKIAAIARRARWMEERAGGVPYCTK